MVNKEEALLDIICLVHDRADWADLAIRAVESFTKNKYRLIVVNMASKEERTKQLFREVENRGHTVLHLAENRSFSAGVNAGVAIGTAKFICVLNDDCMMTEGWDTAMLLDCTEKSVGLVGARSNYVSGAQGDPSFLGEPPYLIFVCVMLRRQVWDQVGQMDAVTFDGFSSEDLDYSWRVKKAGYNLKVSNAYGLHAGSRTLAVTEGDLQARAKNDQKYNARLVEKWGKDWIAAHTKLKGNCLVMTYHAEEHTRVEFMKHVLGLRNSAGVSFSFHAQTRLPIHVARRLAVDYAYDQGFEWLVQLDDDATFPLDLVGRLMAHQKEVVCALAYQRKPPHGVCAFEMSEEGGAVGGTPLEGMENTGLRQVGISGFHCSLIKTSIIKKLRDGVKDADGKVIVPGTRQYFGGFENQLGEDFAFCFNLKKVGVPIHVDTNLISGHIGDAIVVDAAYKAAFAAREAQRRD